MINDHVLGSHIAMHNSLAMSKLKTFKNLACVVSNVEVGKSRVQGSKVCVVDVFEDYTDVRSLPTLNFSSMRST